MSLFTPRAIRQTAADLPRATNRVAGRHYVGFRFLINPASLQFLILDFLQPFNEEVIVEIMYLDFTNSMHRFKKLNKSTFEPFLLSFLFLYAELFLLSYSILSH